MGENDADRGKCRTWRAAPQVDRRALCLCNLSTQYAARPYKEWALAGGLMSYGEDFSAMQSSSL